MINFKFVTFTLVVYVSHKVNVLVTDIILNITSQANLIFTSLHIGSRLFELFSKEVRVKKQPGMPLNNIFSYLVLYHSTCIVKMKMVKWYRSIYIGLQQPLSEIC